MAANINNQAAANPAVDPNVLASESFPQSPANADARRVTGLSELDALTQAHIDSLRLDQARIAAKYGANSARALAAAQALAVVQAGQPLVKAELARTKIEVPKPDPNAATLYGIVVDQNNVPAPEVVVAVVSALLRESKCALEATTDNTGEFVLRLPPQTGTPTIDLELRDPKGVVTRLQETLPLPASIVTYREYTLKAA